MYNSVYNSVRGKLSLKVKMLCTAKRSTILEKHKLPKSRTKLFSFTAII